MVCGDGSEMRHWAEQHPQHSTSAPGTATSTGLGGTPPSSPGALGMGVIKPRALGPNPLVLTPAPPTATQPWKGRGPAASGVTRDR